MKFVSVIVPMRNEEKYIAQCVDSLLANDYPKEYLEILIIDGMSSDASRKIVQEYCSKYPFIHLIENRKCITPIALNIGIRESKGEIIIRADAHTIYPPDYIRQCVTLLETTGADNVGGRLRAKGTTLLGKAIAYANNSRFGIGNAQYRYSNKEKCVDTVYLGAWFKKTLLSLNGFNEEFERVQDYELNYRLRKAGGKILLSPKIHCYYYGREKIKALAKQYFKSGFWRVKVLKLHPKSLRWRQIVPPLFVFGLILSIAIMPFSIFYGLIIPIFYLIANLMFSFYISLREGLKYFFLLPIVFITMHLSWGCGFLMGIFKWGIPKITPSVILKAIKEEL